MCIEDITFSSKLILRTPVLPFTVQTNDEVVLKDPLFLAAIHAASASLYEQIKKSQYHYRQLDSRSRESIWRYRNRMMYRPTPFGKFAAISVVSWGSETALLADSKLTFHSYPDFSINMTAAARYLSGNRHGICYTINNSLYSVNGCFRFLTSEVSGNRDVFAVSEIADDEPLQFLTELCQSPLRLHVIVSRLMARMQWDKQTCTEYITALINASVIVPEPSEQLNVTGTDYLRRKKMVPILCNGEDSPVAHYLITERGMKRAVLGSSWQELIRQGLKVLAKLHIPAEKGHFQEFRKRFIKKYDRRAVRLLEAMDPGIGIGYGPSSVAGANPSLLQGKEEQEGKVSTTSNNWSAIHTRLMKAWLANDNRFAPIILRDEMLAALPEENGSIPNSLTVLFRLVNDRLWIESAGGATGTALVGRFTPVSPAVCQMAMQLASNEETANPDIIFAEICHIEDKHAANIDRREQLHRYEIPVLCGSTAPADMQIPLSDLFIFISNGELVLWSQRLHKRVIPRLSSAYNYSRSDLPLFRFLCDLQYQSLRTIFGINLPALFPGQSFYPRIQLGDKIILAPATWIITASVATQLYSLPLPARTTGIRQTIKEMKWPQFVILAEGDQGLVFNTHKKDDISRLAAMLKPERQMTIKEWLADNPDSTIVQNEQREGFVNQFMTTLYHTATVYRPYKPEIINGAVRRQFIPGSEWLYCKFYVHPSAGNEVLIESILPVIKQLKRQGLIQQWFFIRYRDPEYHIRLRFQVKPLHTGWVLARLGKTLQKQTEAGVIRHFCLDTYEREIERYSAELIDVCETFFCYSTMLIVAWLSLTGTDDSSYAYYHIGFVSALSLLESFGYRDKAAADLLQKFYNAGSGRTNQNNGKHNELMKQQFRETARFLNDAGDTELLIRKKLKRPLKRYDSVVAELAKRTEGWIDKRREMLIGNLLHMHLNRLFVDDGPKREMVFYYVLSRWIFSSIARREKITSALTPDHPRVDTF